VLNNNRKRKAKFINADKYKDEFERSRCFLPISVGQPYHEGEKFAATIRLVNDSNFKECVIVVCDTLQRHTMAIFEPEMDEESLYQKALQNGDAWIERNKSTIETLTIPYQIVRWNKWLFSPLYQQKRKIIDEAYDTDAKFKQAFDDTVSQFLDRIKKRRKAINLSIAFNKSLEYVKEECVVDVLWIKEQFSFIIYPRPRPIAKQIVFEKFIEENHEGFLGRLVVKFK
jgi:tRNA-dependent cyclodipeptide synthase